MNTSALGSYRELENVDLLHDLDARSLHVTADGFSWHDVRPSSLSVSQLVDLSGKLVKALRELLAY